jgi:hypothetical protein
MLGAKSQPCRKCGTIKTLRTSRGRLNGDADGKTMYRLACAKCQNAKKTSAQRERRKRVIDAYGAKCACCGESNREFLSIDHVGGWATEHKKMLGIDVKRNAVGGMSKATQKIYKDIERRGFPSDIFRLLCMNCNWALGIHGYCPHGNVTNERVEGVVFDLETAETNQGYLF